MRVLTVRQPWAWAIIHGGKDVENRTRNIAGGYRGMVAIQAGLAYVKGTPAGLAHRAAHGSEVPTELVFGAVIGVVDLADVHHSDDFDCSNVSCLPCSPWAMDNHHHLKLTEPRTLRTPVPAKGRLGLWTPDDELRAAIEEQLS